MIVVLKYCLFSLPLCQCTVQILLYLFRAWLCPFSAPHPFVFKIQTVSSKWMCISVYFYITKQIRPSCICITVGLFALKGSDTTTKGLVQVHACTKPCDINKLCYTWGSLSQLFLQDLGLWHHLTSVKEGKSQFII